MLTSNHLSDEAKQTSNSRFFYGWAIVAIATLALLVSNGLSIGGIPVFYKFIQADLIASGAVSKENIQSVYGVAPAMTFLLAGFLAPVAGYLLQKLNARTMMIIGCVILGGGLGLYSQSTSALSVYASHALLGASLGFVGVLVNTVLVSNWFVRRRGLALGIVYTGTSFGGAVIPQISNPLIERYGWRTAMLLVSLLVWFILLPAVIVFVKNKPEDIGVLPDGDPTQAVTHGNTSKDELPRMTLVQAIRTPQFWIFSICAALVFYALFVVSQQLNLYLQGPSIGFTSAQAAGVQSLLFILSIAGKFVYGFLADKFATSRVMLVSASTMFLSTLVFLYFDSTTVYLFAILFGLNYGGTFVLLQLLVADYFGTREYGKILGAVTVIETIGGALGTIITGRIADANGGDFAVAFLGLIVVTGLSFALTIVLNIFYRKHAVAV